MGEHNVHGDTVPSSFPDPSDRFSLHQTTSNYIELHQTRFVEFIKQLPFDGHRTMAVSVRHKAIMRCNQRSSRRMLFECRNIGKLQSKFDHVGVVGECSR